MCELLSKLGRPRIDAAQRLDRAGDHARVLAVEIERDEGVREVVVKRARSPRSFVQEQVALSRWFRDWQLDGVAVPELLLADRASLVLVTERLPGRHSDELAVHRAAGRFLAALHGWDIPDTDPLPLAEALTRRWQGWMRAASPVLAPEERALAEALAPRPELFAGARRVPCHRDFTPDNWLWDGERLAVVDFEHARLDLALLDFAKLAVGCWAPAPERARAFFEGYGRPPSAAEYTQLRGAVALHGVASLAWGHVHAQPQFVDEGHRAFALAAGWSDATTLWATSP